MAWSQVRRNLRLPDGRTVLVLRESEAGNRKELDYNRDIKFGDSAEIDRISILYTSGSIKGPRRVCLTIEDPDAGPPADAVFRLECSQERPPGQDSTAQIEFFPGGTNTGQGDTTIENIPPNLYLLPKQVFCIFDVADVDAADVISVDVWLRVE